MPTVTACFVALFGKKKKDILLCRQLFEMYPVYFQATYAKHYENLHHDLTISFINVVPWRPAKRWMSASIYQPKETLREWLKFNLYVWATMPTFGNEAHWVPIAFLSSCCLITFVNFILFFFIWCNAYRSLSIYVGYPVGCYVYNTLSVQSLPNQNQSCLLYSS